MKLSKLAKFVSFAIPLGRWSEPQEIAKAVLFLGSDDSSYDNAVELMVVGGTTGARLELLFFAADRRGAAFWRGEVGEGNLNPSDRCASCDTENLPKV